MLVQLIYSSRVGPAVDNLAVRDILRTSQINNRRVGVTGTLCFSGTFFLQCLEGERGAVNALYNRILADPRHSGSEVLSFIEITRRDFSGWDMGYVALSADKRALFLKYSAAAEFEPGSMSAESVRELYRELIAKTAWLKNEA